MRAPISIGGVEIRAGQSLLTDIPIARLYTHTEMVMPVHVIHGKKDGPRLFVSAGIHGDEINGVETVRRLLKLKLLKKINGTLLAIPIVNVYGFVNKKRELPDGRDLNRFFPGTSRGSLTSRLARLIIDEVASKCTHGIDLHTGSGHRNNLPHIRACLDGIETERLARAFGTTVIIDARLRDGSLREAVSDMGIPMLLFEGGEALRFNETAISVGLKGIISVMREIGMLKAGKTPRRRTGQIVAKNTAWVRAPLSGIVLNPARLGTVVRKDDVLCTIADPYGETEEKVHAAANGVVVGRLELPLVHRGDALFNIASVEGDLNIEMVNEAPAINSGEYVD